MLGLKLRFNFGVEHFGVFVSVMVNFFFWTKLFCLLKVCENPLEGEINFFVPSIKDDPFFLKSSSSLVTFLMDLLWKSLVWD